MNVFIVDDEPLVLDNLEYLLTDYPDVKITLKSTDILSVLEQVKKQKPDVIFLDINMPVMDGLTFANCLSEQGIDTNIVFVTAYDNYAIDSYAYNTTDYILKPVTKEKLSRTMRKLHRLLDDRAPEKAKPAEISMSSVMALRDDRYYLIELKKAQYLYVSGRKLMIVMDGVEYQLKNTFNYWTDVLREQGWMRVHRSYLINLAQIENITPMSNSVYYVKMKNSSEEIVVSRSFISEFREIFNI